jgi:hypothetical protein
LKFSEGIEGIPRDNAIMTYTIETAFGKWKIEEDTQRNWVLLKLKKGEAPWRVVNIFYTVGGAAAAVGCGATMVPEWDEVSHDAARFILSHWQHEPIAGERSSAA